MHDTATTTAPPSSSSSRPQLVASSSSLSSFLPPDPSLNEIDSMRSLPTFSNLDELQVIYHRDQQQHRQEGDHDTGRIIHHQGGEEEEEVLTMTTSTTEDASSANLIHIATNIDSYSYHSYYKYQTLSTSQGRGYGSSYYDDGDFDTPLCMMSYSSFCFQDSDLQLTEEKNDQRDDEDDEGNWHRAEEEEELARKEDGTKRITAESTIPMMYFDPDRLMYTSHPTAFPDDYLLNGQILSSTSTNSMIFPLPPFVAKLKVTTYDEDGDENAWGHFVDLAGDNGRDWYGL